eukprot:GHVS01072378.1.p4 GENE.GHVS01072378.1~~GHVS01072378.1.p4  ORF type:complete len:113 (-),score=22.49 GHVS01072378.1:526-864(-)
MAGIGGGDNDPLDVVEVTGSGGKAATRSVGDVVQIKVLGGLCLIDAGEVDWKILAVDIADPHIAELSEVEDIDRIYPGTTSGPPQCVPSAHLRVWCIRHVYAFENMCLKTCV